MSRVFLSLLPTLLLAVILVSCEQEQDLRTGEAAISQDVIEQIAAMGFNPDGIVRIDEGYRVERDIIITQELLRTQPNEYRVPGAEQYRTTNLVAVGASREVKVYIPIGGTKGFSTNYGKALDEAIARYNSQGLRLTFKRITSTTGANIVYTRLSRFDEFLGVLGSAGFPTAAGDPYNQIKMSGVLESRYGWGVNAIATVMAHEMGHCIGFRHTDYYDRSVSCGGSTSNEGDGGVGAVHIPGTPTDATKAAGSFMLACTDGSDRPFNAEDIVALQFLYK